VLIEKIFKKFIPDDIAKDVGAFSCAKNLVGACLISVITAPLFALLYYALDAYLAAYLILIAEVIILSSLLILKYFSSIFYAYNLVMIALALIFTWLIYSLGGIFSSPSYWLLLLPLIAVFVGGMRAGYFWGAVSVGVISSFYFLEYSHFQFPISPVTHPLLLQFFSMGGLILVVISLVYFYETSKKAALSRLHYIAYHDGLTDLPNRVAYDEMLERLIYRAKKGEYSFAILYFNIDHFKKINNAFGQVIGDALLKKAAERIKSHLQSQDKITRVGGDEFKVILENKQDPDEIKQLVKAILIDLKTPYHINKDEINVTVSAGISSYPLDHFNVDFIDRQADVALAKAKELGGNTLHYFTEVLAKEDALLIEIERNLPYALLNHELSLNFQPQFETHNPKKIRAIEVLLRWNNSRFLDIPSNVFIPIAEKIGMISQLGEWVLKKACVQYMEWFKAGLVDNDICLAVNISVHQLYKENFIYFVEKVLDETGIPPRNLEFELTETAVITDEVYAITILQKLNELGIRTVIDDFGTGYTSLSYLTTLPVSGLKIDKSFIDNIVNQNNSPIIIESLINLAHRINLIVVAEGIETIEQLKHLKNIHCDYVQGYFLSKPLDADAMQALLRPKKAI